MNRFEFGCVGIKEKTITKKYIEDLKQETVLYVENQQKLGAIGSFAKDIDELLELYEFVISEYKNLDEFIANDSSVIKSINDSITKNIDKNKSSKDFTSEELKEIVKKYYHNRRLIKKFEDLKEDETLFLDDQQYFDTDKKSLFLNLMDLGQYQKIYNNKKEILDAIEKNKEEVIIFIVNNMTNSEYENYKTSATQETEK